MAALRHARQLAVGRQAGDGSGLAWPSAGALWTLILAGIERTGVPDAKAALAVQVLNAVLAGSVVLLSTRLLRRLAGAPGLGLPALLLALVPCFDLVFWTVNGFETPLTSALFLLVALRVLADAEHGRLRALTLALLALVPLTRGGLALWAALALLACGLVPARRATLGALVASLAPASAYLLARFGLQGAWWALPPPGQVALLPTGTALGLRYLGRFARGYAVALAVAALGTLATRDPRRVLLLAGPLFGAVWLLAFGGEALPGSPYLAPFVPVLLTLAAAAVTQAARTDRWRALALGAALLTPAALQARASRPTRLAASEPAGMVVGVMIARHSSPEASVGVFAPGSVPYFSRRRCAELLLSPDPARALDARPDLVVVHLPHRAVLADAEGRQAPRDRQVPVLRSAVFRAEYLPNPLSVLERTTLYFRTGSAERERRGAWRVPRLGR